ELLPAFSSLLAPVARVKTRSLWATPTAAWDPSGLNTPAMSPCAAFCKASRFTRCRVVPRVSSTVTTSKVPPSRPMSSSSTMLAFASRTPLNPSGAWSRWSVSTPPLAVTTWIAPRPLRIPTPYTATTAPRYGGGSVLGSGGVGGGGGGTDALGDATDGTATNEALGE